MSQLYAWNVVCETNDYGNEIPLDNGGSIPCDHDEAVVVLATSAMGAASQLCMASIKEIKRIGLAYQTQPTPEVTA